MPKKSVWELHPRGPELEEKLLKGEMKQKEIAAILGITEQAVSIHKRKLMALVKKEVKKEVLKHPEIVKEKIETAFNEIELIKKGIEKLLERQQELEYHAKNYVSPAWYNLVIKNTKEIREACETLLKLKGELLPDVNINIQMTKINQQIIILQNFIFERHPELIDEFESYLREKLEEFKLTNEST